MAQYIDKSALVAEIERHISAIDNCPKFTDTQIVVLEGNKVVLLKLLSFLDTLEVKEVDDELQGIEKEVAESFVERINKKRIPISLKGEKKAKFKNEFNTLWQIIDGIQFANVAKHIIERLCLHFAAWGAYNLKGIGQINKDDNKMDVEVKEVDLKEEIDKIWKPKFSLGWDDKSLLSISYKGFEVIAKHFFELGMAVSNKEQKGE